MKTLGIGLVGARYGARMHLANYAKLPRELVAVRGVCSRTKESGAALAREAQIAFVTDDYDSLLARKDIDVVDICVPPALHHEFAIRAADAGKHIIMEKPLTGYFGNAGDPEPIGTRVPRARMREGARNNAEAVREAVRRNGVQFCYAENWIYAPPIEKMRRLIAASKGAILELRAEENHSGSNSVFSRDWKSTGGGALLRMGVHSVGACLHLKQWEGQLRLGKGIRPVSVLADTADLIHSRASERAREAGANQWISANPVDVENWANLVIGFEDGSRGQRDRQRRRAGRIEHARDGLHDRRRDQGEHDLQRRHRNLRARSVGFSRRIFHGKARDEGGLESAELRRRLVSRLRPGDRGFRGRDPRGPGTPLRHRPRRGMCECDLCGVSVR